MLHSFTGFINILHHFRVWLHEGWRADELYHYSADVYSTDPTVCPARFQIRSLSPGKWTWRALSVLEYIGVLGNHSIPVCSSCDLFLSFPNKMSGNIFSLASLCPASLVSSHINNMWQWCWTVCFIRVIDTWEFDMWTLIVPTLYHNNSHIFLINLSKLLERIQQRGCLCVSLTIFNVHHLQDGSKNFMI